MQLKIRKKARGTPRFFFNFLAQNLLWGLYVLTIGSDWQTIKNVRTDACCSIMSILNGLGEAAVHSREVRGEGVTMLSCARAGRELEVIFEGHRFAQKQYLNKWRLPRRIFVIVTEFTETVTNSDRNFKCQKSDKSNSLVRDLSI